MAIKTEFRGTPLVPKDISFPEISELRGEFGKEVLEEYKGRAEKDYGNASALKILSYSDGVVKGSNPFAVVLINNIVRQNGLRTATPADLEKALNLGIDLTGTYEDSALVLRSKEEPNAYLAKSIADQVALRGNAEYPVMIPLVGFDLTKDADSPHNLGFKLREDAQIIPAGILSKDGAFKSEDVDLATGLPTKLGEGNRYSYTRNSGLSGLYLNRNLNLWSDGVNLASSYSDGRVRIVSGEAASQKALAEYFTKLEKIKDAQISLITEKYLKAKEMLAG